MANYQYPGLPPVNNVAIFVADPSINIVSEEDSPDVLAYKNLWRQFKDMPENETDRLKLFEKNSSKNGWFSWASDITWAKPEEPGVYPADDFKNQRFEHKIAEF